MRDKTDRRTESKPQRRGDAEKKRQHSTNLIKEDVAPRAGLVFSASLRFKLFFNNLPTDKATCDTR